MALVKNSRTTNYIIVILAMLGCLLPGSGVFAKDWVQSEFSTVTAYYYNEQGEFRAPLFVDGVLSTSVVKSVVLKQTEVTELLSMLDVQQPKYSAYLCDKPRHAFVFETDNGRVGHLQVCFECLQFQFYPYVQGKDVDVMGLAALVERLDMPLGPKSTLESIEQAYLKSVEITARTNALK